MKAERIVVGLSGGVDSAVAAHLLKRDGHEVVGVFMKNWEGDDDDEYCSSNADFLREYEAWRIATGHYAQVREQGATSAAAGGTGRFERLRGLDPLKDQSYFLHRLTQPQRARTLFPLGGPADRLRYCVGT